VIPDSANGSSSPSTGAKSAKGAKGQAKISSLAVSRLQQFHERRQGCQPVYNLFGRGTTESGTMGGTVGPKLSKALGSKISTIGIPYSANLDGINCIGLPGGIKCVDQLAALAAKCPSSQFFLSGYSQGAMVARICAAYSKDDVKKRIKGIVTFGDPFNGASVKGLPKDSVKVYCNPSDGVCQG
jgi:cutinase